MEELMASPSRSDSPQKGELGLPNIWNLPARPSVSQLIPAFLDPDAPRLEPVVRSLRMEVLTTKNKADLELQRQDILIRELRKSLAAQKELTGQQNDTIRTLNRSLKDYQIADLSQQRALAQTGASADAKNRALTNKLRELELAHARALELAAEQHDRLKRERTALTMALSAVAAQALGGPDSSAEDLTGDVEAALAEGAEPVPRNPGVWPTLRYELDTHGNLSSFSRHPGTALRPFDKDGARGVAALAAQVGRLYRQRASLKAGSRDLQQQLSRLQHILDNVDTDFNVVNVVVRSLVEQSDMVMAHCQLPDLSHLEAQLESSEPRKVSERLRIVWQLVQHLCGALVIATNSDVEGKSPMAALAAFQQTMSKQHGLEVLGEFDTMLSAARAVQAEAAPVAAPRSQTGSPARAPRGRSPNRAMGYPAGSPTQLLPRQSTAPTSPKTANGAFPGRMRGLVASASQEPPKTAPARSTDQLIGSQPPATGTAAWETAGAAKGTRPESAQSAAEHGAVAARNKGEVSRVVHNGQAHPPLAPVGGVALLGVALLGGTAVQATSNEEVAGTQVANQPATAAADGEDEPATEEPAAEEPPAEEPTAKESLAAEEPTAFEPSAEEPAAEDSFADQPAADEPAAKEPAAKKLAADEPAEVQPAADEPATEELAAQEPVAEEPAADEAATDGLAADEPYALEPTPEEPAAEEPVAVEPVGEEAVVDEPSAGESAACESAADELVAYEPAAGESAACEPAADEPPACEPAADESDAYKPAANESVAVKPNAEVPVASVPVAEEPVADEPVAEEPAADESSAKEPVAEESAADQPAAEEPIGEEPTVEKPAAEGPSADDPASDEPVPAAEEPAADEPVPAAEEPAADEPIAEEPAAGEPFAEQQDEPEEPAVEEPEEPTGAGPVCYTVAASVPGIVPESFFLLEPGDKAVEQPAVEDVVLSEAAAENPRASEEGDAAASGAADADDDSMQAPDEEFESL